jgi:hypothetical protein
MNLHFLVCLSSIITSFSTLRNKRAGQKTKLFCLESAARVPAICGYLSSSNTFFAQERLPHSGHFSQRVVFMWGASKTARYVGTNLWPHFLHL